ncbi:hypothetical protein DHEL01_v211615 [Diaporthe helianthi]|uniref:Uncharacterized protein n=1 Tax=Diaporthe helianthi TaxID=158607 RepID=A0A2P5HIB4_DIAHE|nr:hypothetical protein DHEL01_v211615 [Diaporthe helianthi]
MPPAKRPKLAALATPTSANFPSDALLSASSVRTPHSASFKGSLQSAGLYSAGLPSAGLPSAPFEYPPTPSMLSGKQDDKPEPTPITPPLAYMDFLKTISVASPSVASPPLTAPLMVKAPLTRTSTAASTTSTASAVTCKSEDSTGESAGEVDLDSAPTTASTDSTDYGCSCELVHKSTKPAPISLAQPASPLVAMPLSAPASGPTTFPSLRIPPSPAVDSPVRSPYSARSIKSPFDWDAALKARRYADVKPPTSAVGSGGSHSSRCEKGKSVRHIREVVTRTVTYTPRMDPAPKGKRRKIE